MIKVKLNRAGARALLKHPGVVADLANRGERIARAAGPGMESDTHIGRARARATVRTATNEARRAEASGRRLTAAIDAGR
jgi:hypothetical protein